MAEGTSSPSAHSASRPKSVFLESKGEARAEEEGRVRAGADTSRARSTRRADDLPSRN